MALQACFVVVVLVVVLVVVQMVVLFSHHREKFKRQKHKTCFADDGKGCRRDANRFHSGFSIVVLVLFHVLRI